MSDGWSDGELSRVKGLRDLGSRTDAIWRMEKSHQGGGSIDAPDILTNDILCDLESQSQFDRCMAIDKLLNNILLYHQIKCFLCQNHPHQIAPQTSSSCCFDESTIHITVSTTKRYM